MEAFAPLPVELFSTDTNGLNEEDPSTYFSLSQFDLELQQQAHAALLQQESWQDFDKYLPMDNQLFNNNSITNEQAQPMFNMNNSAFNSNSNTLLYELNDLLSSTQQQQQQQNQRQQKPIFDTSTNITAATSVSNWNNNITIKNEFASPESLPYSPPQNMQSNLSLSPSPNQQQQQQQHQPEMPLFQSTTASTSSPSITTACTTNTTSPITEIKASPKNVNTATTTSTPSLDFINWNNNSSITSSPFDTQQGKTHTLKN
jgi:hypothetical protein